MAIYQTNSLPLPLETFTQPCAEQRKSLVEQTEEITVESLLESNDIQPLGNKLRFLVAPQKSSYRNVAAFFVSCMFVLLQISNLKKLAIDVNFVNNGQLLFPNFISNRLCLGSAAIKISSKDTIT